MSEMALLNSLALATAHCRAWFEYVPSKLNIADALSREGWSAMKDAWIPLTFQVPWHLFQDRLDAALSYVTALGSRACKQNGGAQRWDFYVKRNLQLHPGWDVDDCMIDAFRSLRFHSNAIF